MTDVSLRANPGCQVCYFHPSLWNPRRQFSKGSVNLDTMPYSQGYMAFGLELVHVLPLRSKLG